MWGTTPHYNLEAASSSTEPHVTCSCQRLYQDKKSDVDENALIGYDPLMSNPRELSDPGLRNQIFQLNRETGYTSDNINSFVKSNKISHCDSELKETVLRNYEEYKKEKFSGVSFSLGTNSSVKIGFQALIKKVFNGGFGWMDSEQSKMKQFYRETGGEIVQNTAQCVTRESSINTFVKADFTPAFLTALKSLHMAAQNPESTLSENIFTDFTLTFGTHFMRRTLFGSKLIFESRFASRSANATEESSRIRCASNEAYRSIGDDIKKLSRAFNSLSASQENCDNFSQNIDYFRKQSISSSKITVIGLPSNRHSDNCASSDESSAPIYYELEKISTLFTSKWFATIPFNEVNANVVYLNGTAMQYFFEQMLSSHCEVMIERAEECSTEEKGCGLNSVCAPGTTCVDDPDSALGYKCHGNYGQ